MRLVQIESRLVKLFTSPGSKKALVKCLVHEAAAQDSPATARTTYARRSVSTPSA